MMAQTRLIDYGARQYDPTIARWNGMDPMAEKYPSMTTFNYCNNNPISIIDVDGQQSVVPDDNKDRSSKNKQNISMTVSAAEERQILPEISSVIVITNSTISLKSGKKALVNVDFKEITVQQPNKEHEKKFSRDLQIDGTVSYSMGTTYNTKGKEEEYHSSLGFSIGKNVIKINNHIDTERCDNYLSISYGKQIDEKVNVELTIGIKPKGIIKGIAVIGSMVLLSRLKVPAIKGLIESPATFTVGPMAKK